MGITQEVLREWRHKDVSKDDVKALQRDEAPQIYRARYWEPLRCDEMPIALTLMTYNAGVNCGIGRGACWLQEALNKQGERLDVDGEVGPLTLSACARNQGCEAPPRRGSSVMACLMPTVSYVAVASARLHRPCHLVYQSISGIRLPSQKGDKAMRKTRLSLLQAYRLGYRRGLNRAQAVMRSKVDQWEAEIGELQDLYQMLVGDVRCARDEQAIERAVSERAMLSDELLN